MSEKNEWKSIDSAPKDGTPVLLFARHVDAEASTRVVGWFNADYGWIAQSYIGQPVARLIPSQWAELLPFPGTPASVAPGDAQDEQAALEHAYAWILKAPHGDNCYLDPDHDLGKSCECGKDSLLAHLEQRYLQGPAPATGDAQDDQTRWTLRWIMRQADAAKETCGTDPESPAAIRNAKLAAISAAAAQALGLVRGPSYADSAGGDALDAARWRWVLSHAENVGFDYRSGRSTTLTVAGRQGDSLVAFVDAALAAQVPQQGEA